MIINILICSICWWSGQSNIIPKGEIKDPIVFKLLDEYTNLIKRKDWDNPHKQQLLLRVEGSGRNRIIYLGCAGLLSNFVSDLPDCYVEYGNRLIFIYSKKYAHGDAKERFLEFYEQFGSSLGKDILPNVTQNPNFQYGIIHHPEIWQTEVSGNHLGQTRQIPRFPTNSFYSTYKYDNDGRLMYKDGVYTSSGVTPHQWEPEGFDIRKYILRNTSVPVDSLTQSMVNAIIVIDERGKVTESVIEGIKDAKTIVELQEALKRMTPLNPGKIGGKPVKVRLRWRL